MPLLHEMKNLARGLMASKRFVLLIGDKGAMIARLSGNTVQAHHYLDAAEDENLRRAKVIFAAAPDLPILVLYDVLGQSYRQERVPAVSLFDRSKILARKLETIFPGVEMRGGVRLGPTPGDQRGIAYLFASLNPSPDLTSWMKLLEEISNPVSDMRLLPAESVSLLKCLTEHKHQAGAAQGEWRMLISQQRTGGFRQIVTRDHKLAITRMTPAPDTLDKLDEIAELLRNEVGATIDYITRLGFDRAQGIDAVFIGREDVGSAIVRAQPPVQRLRVIAPQAAERQAGLTGAQDDSGHFADLLHAAWGSSQIFSPLSVMAPPKRRERMLAVGQSWATRLLAAISAAGLIYAGILGLELQDAKTAYHAVESAREEMQQVYDQQVSTLDNGPVAMARIRDVLDLRRQLEAGNIDFDATYQAIEEALPENVRLSAVSIAVEPRPVSLVEGNPYAASGQERTGNESVNGKIILSVDLSGFVKALPAISETERLAEALRKALPDMRVSIRRQPLQILPGDTLAVKSGENLLASAGNMESAEIELNGKLK
jgi:hypothetical protein